MGKSKILFCVLALSLGLATVSRAAELGIFAGGLSKDTNISLPQSAINRDIFKRSYTNYFGLSVASNIFVPFLEMQHTAGLALKADNSARPNTFIYSGNLHLVIPLDIVRLRPYAGGGLGFFYNYGSKPGLRDIADNLGKSFYFQVNVGGGVKIKLIKALWLRLDVRDYILLNMEKANLDENNDLISITKKSSHNVALTAGLSFSY